MYYNNSTIKYKGDFVNGIMEGMCKYIFDNGFYYIGQCSNGMRNGKGIVYYKNNKIQYEGEFVDGKMEGNGIYIFEDGEYYISNKSKKLRDQ